MRCEPKKRVRAGDHLASSSHLFLPKQDTAQAPSLLSRIRHSPLSLVLLLHGPSARQKRLAVLDLLVLLHEGAAAAAARDGEVTEAAALEVEAVTDLLALHGHHAEGEGDAGGADEEEALYSCVSKPAE